MDKKPKRTLKDSVFLALFKILSNAMKLYKRFHPEDKTVTEADCEILTLQTVLVNGIDDIHGGAKHIQPKYRHADCPVLF